MNVSAFKNATTESLNVPTSKYFAGVQGVLAIAALVSLIAFLFEHFAREAYPLTIFFVQWITTIIFTVEYAARIWTAAKKIRYFTSFFGIVDFLSILPTYIGVGNFTFLKAIRAIRILRTLRIVGVASLYKYFKREE